MDVVFSYVVETGDDLSISLLLYETDDGLRVCNGHHS